MRLLNTETLGFEEFNDPKEVPKYAILSHRSLSSDISYKEWRRILKTGTQRDVKTESHRKIFKFCELAARKEFKYGWLDNCCIDTRSSAEHSEAINSMYSWYKHAAICITYLSDVPPIKEGWEAVKAKLRSSEWFQRGWTLQELLAPQVMEFYSCDWDSIRNRNDREMSEVLSDITGIPSRYLQGDEELVKTASIAERMRWASSRKTTKPEDIAYSMLGIFDVNMPVIYGEGAVKAFVRMQQEITRTSPDESVFAWCMKPQSPKLDGWHGLLAPTPKCFATCEEITFCPEVNKLANGSIYSWNNLGLMIQATIFGGVNAILLLNCRDPDGDCKVKIRIHDELRVSSLLREARLQSKGCRVRVRGADRYVIYL